MWYDGVRMPEDYETKRRIVARYVATLIDLADRTTPLDPGLLDRIEKWLDRLAEIERRRALASPSGEG